MDENLMSQTNDILEIDIPAEEIEQEIVVTDAEAEITSIETTQDVIVEQEPELVVDISESMGWVSGDSRYHDSLLGTDREKQHPIRAIDGLKEELDNLKAIKTVYSDKFNVANFYEWKDAAYDEYGYFVSLVPDTSTIQICEGTDIFGVSVESAGFIGGKSTLAPRGNSYGLIVTSGLVDVRCELDIKVGDCVTSNAYGYAEKSNSDYGYKVLARENKDGVEYAVIMLGVQADITNAIGLEMAIIDERLDAAESNIISAVNIANQAYNKANEIDASNQSMSDKVDNALGVVDKVVSDVENLETQVSNSTLMSTQAKAIAESAATSAESTRVEAIAKTNEALAETSELRKEFEEKVEQIDTELENTVLELEATKEDILEIKEELQQSIEDTKADVNATNDEIKKDIADTKASLKETQEDVISLREDIEPLASWPAGSDDPTGIAGFVAQADENSATLGSLVEWQGETDKSIAAFKQEVADNYATQVMLSEVGDNLALFKQEVSDTYATQEMVSVVDDNLAKYKQEVTDTYATQEMVSSVDDALTSYKQEVLNNYATQQMLSSVEDNITSFKQEVSDTYATQEMVTTVGNNLASFKQEVKDDYATQEMLTSVDNALVAYKQEVEKNYATQQMLSTVEDNLASYKQEATDTYATQQMVTAVGENLASYKQEVGETYATQEMVTKLETDTSKALADYKQEVEDGYATQEMVTKLETDTSKALSDYKQEVTDTYATQTSLTTLRTDTTNAIAASEEKATATYASKSDLTSFESDTNVAMARIEQKADANGAYIQSTVSNMDKYSVGTYSQAYGFTLEQAGSVLEEGMIYVPTESVTEKYEYTENETAKTYERSFTRGYLYRWGKPDGYPYGWITVDKNYSEDKLNTSAPAVYFATQPPSVSGEFGYWYTEGDEVTDGYEPYTLYKWESYVDENDATQYHWVAVATLAGNSQSRAVSQIRQDANSIELRVTNTEGSYAGLRAELTDTQADVQSLASWTKDADGKQYNLATIKQTADDAGASIAQVVEAVGEDGKVTSASIITSINGDKSGVTIQADHINLNGAVTIGDFSSDAQNNLIKSTTIQYGLSDSETTEPTSWVDANDWGKGDNVWTVGKYVWQKTTVIKVNGQTTVTKACIQGAKGETGATLYTWIKYADNEYGLNMSDDPAGKSYMGIATNQVVANEGTDPSKYKWTLMKGQDTMSCYMESSAGTSFEASATGTTILTAYLYEGTNEMDTDGSFTYTWYARDKFGTDVEIGEGKTLTVNVSTVAGKSVYFIADDGDAENTSVLYLARLGVMVLNKGV